MRLLDAILDCNSRFRPGEGGGRLKPEEYAEALPLVALTCIDARLNHLLPDALGVPEESFIWTRNAGNIITGPLSSTMRSLALACLVKGGREIAVIGHSDCLVGKSNMLKLTDAMRALGVDRARLPENLVDYFGLFSSERQNVMKAVEHIRGSPLIGPKVPVHGLMVNLDTGRLEVVVNGYRALDTATSQFTSTIRKAETIAKSLEDLPDFKIGNLEFPTAKIGDAASKLGEALHKFETKFEAAGTAIGHDQQSIGSARSHEQPHTHADENHQKTIADRVVEKIEERVGDYVEQRVGAAAGAVEDLVQRLVQKVDPNRRYLLIGSDQKRYGPVAGRIVRQWLTDNRIDANTPVQLEGSEIWQTLGSLPDAKSVRLPPPISSVGHKKKW